MKIYVGCAIQHLNDGDWKKFYGELDLLKENLRKNGHEILDFVSSPNSRNYDPKEVFEHDREQCMKCDAMIAIATNPSTGMGMEIMMCLYGRKEPALVFATAPKGSNVSKMVTGCTHPSYRFEWCDQLSDIPGLFEKHIQTVNK